MLTCFCWTVPDTQELFISALSTLFYQILHQNHKTLNSPRGWPELSKRSPSIRRTMDTIKHLWTKGWDSMPSSGAKGWLNGRFDLISSPLESPPARMVSRAAGIDTGMTLSFPHHIEMSPAQDKRDEQTMTRAHFDARRKQNVSLVKQTDTGQHKYATWFTCITACCQARGWLFGALGGMWARSNCSVTLRLSSSRARVSCSKRASCSFTEARMLAAERTS